MARKSSLIFLWHCSCVLYSVRQGMLEFMWKKAGRVEFSALPWKESGQKATIIEKFGKGSLRFKGQKGFAYVEEAEKGIM